MIRSSFLLLLIFPLVSAIDSPAQDSLKFPEAGPEKRIRLNGYLKSLQFIRFSDRFHNSVSNNLIHNRLNLKWKPQGRFSGALEVRNRMFWGEEVKTNPAFEELLENQTEAIHLSKVWLSSPSLVIHSNIERLWAGYHGKNISMRLGRQRINWGINTLWNPNDLFNNLDFDYEERPGSDAIQGQYHFSDNMSLELAAAASGQKKQITALRLSGNCLNYDVQLIVAWFMDQPAAGAGWAGNIAEAGFKGECMYFFNSEKSEDQMNMSLELDYMFKNDWYVNLAGLFNKNGTNHQLSSSENFDFRLSPQNLLPVKWTLALTTIKQLNPLLQISFTGTYSPGSMLTILYPSLRYNLATNLDADLVWQSFLAKQSSDFKDLSDLASLRLRWSF